MKLSTTTQRISELMERDVSRARFMAQFRSYLDGCGMSMRKPPLMGGREIDLYRLHQVVVGLGGYHLITQEKRWVEVGQQLKLKEASHSAYALRQHYSKWLLQYELLLQGEQREPRAKVGASGEDAGSSPRVNGSDGAPAASTNEAETLGVLQEASAGGAGCSWNSLALQVQDLEERIPWDAVRQGDSDCDWALLRPCFLQLMKEQGLREGGHDCRTMSQAVLTLESVLDDSALTDKWCKQLRQKWRRDLLGASTATQLRQLLSSLERNLRWGNFDSGASDDEEDTGPVQKRGPGRPPKRGRAPTNPKAKKTRTASPDKEVGNGDRAGDEMQVEAGSSGGQPAEAEEGASDDEMRGDGAAKSEPPVDGGSGKNGDGVAEDEEGRDDEKEPKEKVARRTRHAMMQETMMQRALSAGAPSGRREESDEDDEEGAQPPAEEEELSHTIDGFMQLAANYKNSFFGGNVKGAKKGSKPGLVAADVEVAPDKVEAEFWRLVQGGDRGERAREFDVCYSAVAQSCGAGGGFPRRDEPGAAREEPYTSAAWNPHNLPRQPGCVLSHMDDAALSVVC